MINDLTLKGWLVQNRIKQREIADLLGISLTSAYNKLNGRTDFTLEQIRIICAHYGLSAEIFLPPELRMGNTIKRENEING